MKELTLNYCIDVFKYLQNIHVDNGFKQLIGTREEWKRLGYEFTDEQYDNAEKNDCPIYISNEYRTEYLLRKGRLFDIIKD